MNTPTTNKNIAIWNDQALDLWHDIVVSFEYCRFNRDFPPTGGFCIAFFSGLVNMPHGGGPDYALGYNPSTNTEYCKRTGSAGLEGAFLGIGFDSAGEFGRKTTLVGGVTATNVNSFAVRNGTEENYGLIYNSPSINNIAASLNNFFIDEFLPNNEAPSYRAVRVVLTKNGTDLKIQLKQDANDELFTTVYRVELPESIRLNLRVALTNTTSDPKTEFKIRNFNVAGFPGDPTTQLIDSCSQHIFQPGIMEFDKLNVLPVGKEYVTAPFQGNLITYTTDSVKYIPKNTLYGNIKLLGDDNNSIVGAYVNAPTVNIYRYLGQKLVLTDVIDTPDQEFPLSADIDGNSLVFCTSGNAGTVFIYEYIVDINSPAVGTWELQQTIKAIDIDRGNGLGNQAAINGDNLFVSNINEIVHAFQRNIFGQWVELQTITCPNSGITKFGASLDIRGRDAVIGAPYSKKPEFNTTGEGEVFHYYLSSNTNHWSCIMSIGNFYTLNTVAGNFGQSVKLNENSCIIGSPGEMWADNDVKEDIPNAGRAYVFRKTDNGYFTQGTVLYPASSFLTKYLFFGQAVNMYDKYAFVASPYWYSDIIRDQKSYISIFDTSCVFAAPPLHLPVPTRAIDLLDRGGYTISFKNDTYLVESVGGDPLVNDPGIVTQSTLSEFLSGLPYKIAVEGYGTDPLYYWWQKNGQFITPFPTAGLSALGSTFTSLSDSGDYYCIVSNLYGSVSSNQITLVVYYAGQFTFQSVSMTVSAGGNALFFCYAVGNPNPDYQWEFDDGFGYQPISNETFPVIYLNNVTSGMDGYKYRCAVTNTAGTVYSDEATLTVT